MRYKYRATDVNERKEILLMLISKYKVSTNPGLLTGLDLVSDYTTWPYIMVVTHEDEVKKVGLISDNNTEYDIEVMNLSNLYNVIGLGNNPKYNGEGIKFKFI